MAWNGMEWNGMEWNKMEWNKVEWNGIKWDGMECYMVERERGERGRVGRHAEAEAVSEPAERKEAADGREALERLGRELGARHATVTLLR